MDFPDLLLVDLLCLEVQHFNQVKFLAPLPKTGGVYDFIILVCSENW